MKTNTIHSIIMIVLGAVVAMSSATLAVDQERFLKLRWTNIATQMPDAWYGSVQAKTVAENVLKYQTEIGGWAKNSGYHNNSIKQDEWKRIQTYGVGATFDNDSTLTEMKFLAKVYAQQRDERYREAFIKALDYIFLAQYDNGGFPQYYPPRKKKSAYSAHITYNDDVMVNVIRFLGDIAHGDPLFAPLQIGEERKHKAEKSVEKAIDCILQTQIIIEGLPTVWCAQHNEFDLLPAGAREYELPSFSGGESVGVTLLLMDIENPSKEIINAVNGAVKWFDEHKIEGIRVEDTGHREQGRPESDNGNKMSINAAPVRDRVVVQDSSAPPLWGRFHDLETGEAFFCDRDAIKKKTLAEIGINRRGGYNWYTNGPQKVLDRYPQWTRKHNVKPGHVTRVENSKQAEGLAKLIEDQKRIQATLIPGQKPKYISHLLAPDAKPVYTSRPMAPRTGLAKLEAEVGLSAEQQVKVDVLLTAMNEKRREVRNAGLPRPEMRRQFKAVSNDHMDKIRALMTAEQFKKWNTWQEAIRNSRNTM